MPLHAGPLLPCSRAEGSPVLASGEPAGVTCRCTQQGQMSDICCFQQVGGNACHVTKICPSYLLVRFVPFFVVFCAALNSFCIRPAALITKLESKFVDALCCCPFFEEDIHMGKHGGVLQNNLYWPSLSCYDQLCTSAICLDGMCMCNTFTIPPLQGDAWKGGSQLALPIPAHPQCNQCAVQVAHTILSVWQVLCSMLTRYCL
ncbi:hypothetical protein COO60DRAFT_644709 [Scenedesmus sp. NREL 46B-D3]|nr:hypothetical protein COO60DRAFT_644709 [Scenedesmus sp. NREL 46B-D3]